MKATPTKTQAAQPAKKTAPFFKKGPGQGFFKPAGIQTKLTVGAPDDVYEREADQTADRVVRGMHAEPSGGGAGAGISRKPIFESENDPADTIQRKCAACEKEEKVQKKAAGGAAAAASPAIESGISRSKGSGSALPSATRSQMESSFGTDLSGVRIHQDSGARQMNKDLNAQAFTHGKDIYFDSGKYSPGSSEGKHLLAHELTHVVQQTGKGAPKKTAQRKARTAAGSAGSPAGGMSMVSASGSSGSTGAAANSFSPGAVQQSDALQGGMMQEAPPEMESMGGSIQRSISPTGLAIQKDDPPAPATESDGDKLAKVGPAKEGLIEYNENASKASDKFKIVLLDFKLKKYQDVPYHEPPKDSVKPQGDRDTQQAGEWQKKAQDKAKASLTGLYPKAADGKTYMLTVKGGSKTDSKSKILGNIDTLTKATTVPFWDKTGKPTIHQIEHVVDWQIVGKAADTMPDNLILLDKETNNQQGQVVKDLIKTQVETVLKHYSSTGLPIAKLSYRSASSTYNILFRTFSQREVKAKSTIQENQMGKAEAGAEGIFSPTTVDITEEKIPPGHCLIKTATDGVGFIVPYNYNGDIIKIEGDADNHELKKITQMKLIKKDGNIVGAKKKLDLTFEASQVNGVVTKDEYMMTHGSHAAVLQESLKLVGMSPIEFSDESIDVSPITGVKAEGKVKPDISLLKDADIGFMLDNAAFTVYAMISTDALKGKLPSPLSIDNCELGVSMSSDDPLSVFGGIDFSIKNVGTGRLTGSAGTKGFGVEGNFSFDNMKSFKKAEIGFKYFRPSGQGEGQWEGNGEIAFEKDVIPGVKQGNIKISYKEGVLSGAGDFTLSIEQLDKVSVEAKFDQNGNFSITGKTHLNKVPGIKDSEISVTLNKDEGGYSLGVAGTATPDLPNVPGLGATLTVSYNKGVFTLEGTATYEKDKLKGSLTVGVTNAVVDENGAPSKDNTDGKMKIYGSGGITLHLLKGVDATLHGAVDGNGEMYVWGDMDVVATPFDPIDINKTLFDVKTSIPLVGIPFASINLDLGTSGKFYFHWDPLTIKLHASLDRTNIKEIGSAGGELTASLSSHAKAGFIFTISAGVSVSIAIIKLGAHINGSVDLGLEAEVGASANAHWDMQKGLQLESAEAHLTGVPKVAFILSGDITADVDLWLTSYQVYKREMELGRKELDLSQFAFGLSVPLKIDESGKIEGIDYDKIKVTPELGQGAGDKISDQVLNGDDRKKKEEKEREAREKIRTKVVQKLQAKKADGETDLRSYAEDLKSDIKDDTPDELASMVDEVVEEELRKMEREQAQAAAPPPTPPEDNNTGGAPGAQAPQGTPGSPPAAPAPVTPQDATPVPAST